MDSSASPALLTLSPEGVLAWHAGGGGARGRGSAGRVGAGAGKELRGFSGVRVARPGVRAGGGDAAGFPPLLAGFCAGLSHPPLPSAPVAGGWLAGRPGGAGGCGAGRRHRCRPALARHGVSHPPGAGGAVDGAECRDVRPRGGVRRRHGRGAGGHRSGVAAGGTGHAASRGEPEQPGVSLRLSRHLQPPAGRAGQGAASPAGSGLARNRRGGKRRSPPHPADPAARGLRCQPADAGSHRKPPRFPAPGLDAGGGVAVSPGDTEAGGLRADGPRAGLVEPGPVRGEARRDRHGGKAANSGRAWVWIPS